MKENPRGNINRILVKTPKEKTTLKGLKKEVSNTPFTVAFKDFKSVKHTLNEKSISYSV